MKEIWMGHAGHFICSSHCQFHLNTYVNGYIISTVGELWNERAIREIHAKIHDPKWLLDNGNKKGDDFDSAYMKRFGFEDIGFKRKYETMVFKAKKSKHKCCPYEMCSGDNVDFDSYNTADEAQVGHYKMLRKWSK